MSLPRNRSSTMQSNWDKGNAKPQKDEPPVMVRSVSGPKSTADDINSNTHTEGTRVSNIATGGKRLNKRMPIGEEALKAVRQKISNSLLISEPSRSQQHISENGRYQPGWSIPKLNVEELGAPSRASTMKRQNVPPVPLKELDSVKKNMLTRFDEAVLNLNPKLAQAKANAMRRQLRKAEGKLKTSSMSRLGSEMEKMRNKVLSNISSDLGFGYEFNPDRGRENEQQPLTNIRLAPAKTDSWNVVSTQMDKEMRNWSMDAHKIENRDWVKSSFNSNRLRARSRPQNSSTGTLKEYLEMGIEKSARRVVNSEDKLSTISKGFRKTLKPIASRDVRDLIPTPPDNAMNELEIRHSQSLLTRSNQGDNVKAVKARPPKFGSEKVKLSRKQNVKPKTTTTKSQSQDLSGLMNFRDLLEMNHSEPEKSPKGKSKYIPSEEDLTISTAPLQEETPAYPRLSGTEIHGQLYNSVKSLDHAAKIAQSLGDLMSKVALQQSPIKPTGSIKSDNDRPLKFTNGPTEPFQPRVVTSTSMSIFTPAEQNAEPIDPELEQNRKRNPYNPISDEIKRRADRLSDVVEQAELNLKQHGAVMGINFDEEETSKTNVTKNQKPIPANVGPRTRSSSTSVGFIPSNANESGTQTQTDKSQEAHLKSEKFEFVSDMSFTDQLMLKKLRNLQSSWDDSKD